ncbi:MAG: hypothetical protein CM15mP54_12240 [Paracoccaceae bacterium]|nr:MAG: hypothetical protein CM15mP54_12240 [Paracoccaceae bacterium]
MATVKQTKVFGKDFNLLHNQTDGNDKQQALELAEKKRLCK